MPRLSICIPFYNAERDLGTCARALFAQKIIEDLELIFVDDGSTDGSLQTLERSLAPFASRRSQVQIIRQRHAGVAAARNKALAAATGRYLAQCDADDRVGPDFYGRLLAAAEKVGADMAYCGLSVESPDGRIVEQRPVPYATATDFICAELPSQLFNSPCNKIYSTEFLRARGLCYSSELSVGSDLAFNVQALCAKPTIACCDETGYVYRYNPQSISHARHPNDGRSILGFVDLFFPLLVDRRFAAARDRLLRNALLAAIRYRLLTPEAYRQLRAQMTGALTDDARYGWAKKMLLILANWSYPVACQLARLYMRLSLGRG